MKKFVSFLWVIMVTGASCSKSDDPIPTTLLEVAITGTINHSDYTAGQTGTVTFTRFPATVSEFKQVRDRIGGEPHGAVALQLMAYEMYRRNRSRGEESIRLNNVNTNITSALSQLRQLFSII